MTLVLKSKCDNYPFFCLDCKDYCDNSNRLVSSGFGVLMETRSPFNHSQLLKHKVVILQ